jgi:hypothetical protein
MSTAQPLTNTFAPLATLCDRMIVLGPWPSGPDNHDPSAGAGCAKLGPMLVSAMHAAAIPVNNFNR